MNVIVALYTLREQKHANVSYGVTLVANINNGKLEFNVEVTKVCGDDILHILLHEILEEEIKDKISQRIEQFNKIKNAINDTYKNFFNLISEYPFISKNSTLFSDCYNEANKINVEIGNKKYSEIYMLLNYDLVCKKLNLNNGYVTRKNIEEYIKDYIFKECNEVVPKYVFTFMRENDKRELIFKGNYDRFHDKCLAVIYDYNDFKFLNKKYKGEQLYVIPIRERILEFTGTSIWDYGYNYFNYTSQYSRFCRESRSKKGALIIVRKNVKNINKIDEFVSKLVDRKSFWQYCILDLEKGYEDSNIVIYVVKKI
ncbi:MAG: hypothetical protein J6A15_01940 [Clostridia bacterium]|nr:hypothetical protein [Clostridia bacterium]